MWRHPSRRPPSERRDASETRKTLAQVTKPLPAFRDFDNGFRGFGAAFLDSLVKVQILFGGVAEKVSRNPKVGPSWKEMNQT